MRAFNERLTMLIESSPSGRAVRTGCWSDTPDKKVQERRSQARQCATMLNGLDCVHRQINAHGAQ